MTIRTPHCFNLSFRHPLLRKGLLFSSCLLLGTSVMADTLPATATNTAIPYLPGVSVTGLSGDITTGYADMMLPLFGQPTKFLYLDPQGLFHNNDDYSASLGLGGRWLTEKAGILGAYVFGDYNHAPDGHGFYFVSPGIERLGDRLDLSANLYIPVGSQSVYEGNFFGDQLGIYNTVTFAGHNQYDGIYSLTESVGIGGDIEAGYRLPVANNTKIYVGGYYFDPQDASSITGGTVRADIPFTDRLSMTVSDGYDNYAHNTFKAGLTYNFVARHTSMAFKGNLQERMVDPIQRNLIAVSGSGETAQPIFQTTTQVGTGLEVTDISFFLPGGSTAAGDGTYENPYIGFNTANVDAGNLAGNNIFYLNSGVYTPGSAVTLENDQVYGRQSYHGRPFVMLAQGNNRPMLQFGDTDGLIIPGTDTNDSINNVQIVGPSTAGHAGIWIDHNTTTDQTVTINNTNVENFGDGIDMLNSASGILTVNVNNSLISGNAGGGELLASEKTEGGIAAANTSTGTLNLNVAGSTITGNSYTVNGGGLTYNAIGGLAVYNAASGTMNVQVNNSTISENTVAVNPDATTGTVDATVHAAGGLAVDNNAGTVTVGVNQSNISGNTVTANENAEVTATVTAILYASGGLAVYNNTSGTTTLNVNETNISGNTVTANANADGSSATLDAAGGLAAYSTGTMMLNVNQSNISGNAVMANEGAGSSSGILFSSGGLAVFNMTATGAMTVNVNETNISGNTVDVEPSQTSLDTSGGIAAYNSVGGTTILNINETNISGNTVNELPTLGTNVIGGVALYNVGGGSTTTTITDSSITNNGIGIDALTNGGSNSVTVDASTIDSNVTAALIADGAGTSIDVTNPVLLDGFVEQVGASTITIQGLPYTGTTYVHCSNGQCTPP